MFEGKRAQALYIRVTITRTSEYLDTCLGRALVKHRTAHASDPSTRHIRHGQIQTLTTKACRMSLRLMLTHKSQNLAMSAAL